MSDGKAYALIAALGFISVFGCIGFVVSNEAVQHSKRVEAACAGDLSDPARSAVCAMAVAVRR
jgi:hypothetical protein